MQHKNKCRYGAKVKKVVFRPIREKRLYKRCEGGDLKSLS